MKDAVRQREGHRRSVHATQKQDIVGKVTDAMVEIEGENMRPVALAAGQPVA
jgi:phenylpyruvate tautomerase PptA (4-oxalocrotonate tautomerase family)